MERRSFLRSSAALGGLALSDLVVPDLTAPAFARRRRPTGGDPFHLKFAPHFGMFRSLAGDDHVAQLEFMAAEGFRALEDNGMASRSAGDQERIAGAMERLEMEMGVFVAHAEFGQVTFASDDEAARERIVKDMEQAVEVAKRVNARWCTVVPGTYRKDVEWDYQTATVIENLKRAAAVCEPHGLVMVLEPLNAWRDHPGLFLTKIPQAYLICRAVGSPSCKILDDLYHQQISEGNLIPNIERAWDEIAYYQIGDNPGRKEPGTGEIHYKRIFQHLLDRGFDGIVGMEHGNSGAGAEGERAVIDAYRRWDPS